MDPRVLGERLRLTLINTSGWGITKREDERPDLAALLLDPPSRLTRQKCHLAVPSSVICLGVPLPYWCLKEGGEWIPLTYNDRHKILTIRILVPYSPSPTPPQAPVSIFSFA